MTNKLINYAFLAIMKRTNTQEKNHKKEAKVAKTEAALCITPDKKRTRHLQVQFRGINHPYCQEGKKKQKK